MFIYDCTKTFPKKDRYTLGKICENSTLKILELLFMANSKPNREKLAVLNIIDVKLKVLKTYIRAAFDVQAIDQNQYIELQKCLQEIGSMLGGWIKSLK